ncbi:MAG: hypothetical protein QFE16_16755, partial [Pseudomonadota bacterium]|nr:hypothetical protein [Pseudomonadota bacterium]
MQHRPAQPLQRVVDGQRLRVLHEQAGLSRTARTLPDLVAAEVVLADSSRIGEDFLAETLGKSLISPIPDAAPSGADGKKTDAQFAAETVRKSGEELIAKLTAGLDNEG